VLPPILVSLVGVAWTGALRYETVAGMKDADSSPALYWKVCLINGAVFVAATALLVVHRQPAVTG
jgi:hypothetical protein